MQEVQLKDRYFHDGKQNKKNVLGFIKKDGQEFKPHLFIDTNLKFIDRIKFENDISSFYKLIGFK